MVGNEFSDFFITFAPEFKYFMIMNTNQHLWLINLLKRNSELTFKQIAEYWEVANCNVKGSQLVCRKANSKHKPLGAFMFVC